MAPIPTLSSKTLLHSHRTPTPQLSASWRTIRHGELAMELASVLKLITGMAGLILDKDIPVKWGAVSLTSFKGKGTTEAEIIEICPTQAGMNVNVPYSPDEVDRVIGITIHEAVHAKLGMPWVKDKDLSIGGELWSTRQALELGEEVYADNWIRRHEPFLHNYLRKARLFSAGIGPKDESLHNDLIRFMVYHESFGAPPPEVAKDMETVLRVLDPLYSQDLTLSQRATLYIQLGNKLKAPPPKLSFPASTGWEASQLPSAKFRPRQRDSEAGFTGVPDDLLLQGLEIDRLPNESCPVTWAMGDIDKDIPSPIPRNILQSAMTEANQMDLATVDVSEGTHRLDGYVKQGKPLEVKVTHLDEVPWNIPDSDPSNIISILSKYKNIRGRHTVRRTPEGKLDTKRLAAHRLTGHIHKRNKVVPRQDLELVLLLDCSGSMRGNWGIYEEAGKVFTGLRRGHNKVWIYSYCHSGNTVHIDNLAPNGILHKPRIAGSTPSSEALLAIMGFHPQATIIHFTDGMPNVGVSMEQVVEIQEVDYPDTLVSTACFGGQADPHAYPPDNERFYTHHVKSVRGWRSMLEEKVEDWAKSRLT